MLAAAAWAPSAIGRPLTPLVVAAAVPLILTPRILSAFFREVLELDPRHAMARTAAQQAITWVTFVSPVRDRRRARAASPRMVRLMPGPAARRGAGRSRGADAFCDCGSRFRRVHA